MIPVWYNLPLTTLRVLHRIAKDEHKGARPFFRTPQDMIRLRDRIAELEAE